MAALWGSHNCIFCSTTLIRDTAGEEVAAFYYAIDFGVSDDYRARSEARIGICPTCGWWRFAVVTACPAVLGFVRPRYFYDVRWGSLKPLDLADLTVPVAEVRDYLAAKFNARFSIHPRIFEEVVASVFRDHGYQVFVTAYSGDNGIDMILEKEGGSRVGVQVKRHKRRIAVSQIRELTGALVVNGLTKGVFVTTSEFQRGASRTAHVSGLRGYPVELLDAGRFYDALKIAQLSSAKDVLHSKPWGAVTEWGPWA